MGLFLYILYLVYVSVMYVFKVHLSLSRLSSFHRHSLLLSLKLSMGSHGASSVSQNWVVKNSLPMWETLVGSLGWENSPGEENDNRLQYSCLGNPTDSGAWQATVHGISKSWTWLQLCVSLNILWHCLFWDWNENRPFPVLWPLLSFPNLLAYWVQYFNSIIF